MMLVEGCAIVTGYKSLAVCSLVFDSVSEWTFKAGSKLNFVFIGQISPNLALRHVMPSSLRFVSVLAAG